MSINDLNVDQVPDMFTRKILFILYNIALYASALTEMMALEVISKYTYDILFEHIAALKNTRVMIIPSLIPVT